MCMYSMYGTAQKHLRVMETITKLSQGVNEWLFVLFNMWPFDGHVTHPGCTLSLTVAAGHHHQLFATHQEKRWIDGWMISKSGKTKK